MAAFITVSETSCAACEAWAPTIFAEVSRKLCPIFCVSFVILFVSVLIPRTLGPDVVFEAGEFLKMNTQIKAKSNTPMIKPILVFI
jgi:hypothetical protein